MSKQSRPTYKSQKSSKKRLFIIVGAVLVGVAATLAILEMTDLTHFFHKEPTVFTPTPTTGGASVDSQKGEVSSGDGSTSNSGTTEPGDDKSNTGGSTTSAAPNTPTGDFVSNHRPNLSGSPAPNTISSVCTTTPGASCTITFTKDGVTKSLAAQTTDRGGSAYWNWKLQDVGLTEGSWKVQATATLNGQSKSAADPLNLEVSP